jgi:hypothetical protein
MRTELLRFNGAVEWDPAIDAWMKEHAGELGAIAHHWFEMMRKCVDEIRELLHKRLPGCMFGRCALRLRQAGTGNGRKPRNAKQADRHGVLGPDVTGKRRVRRPEPHGRLATARPRFPARATLAMPPRTAIRNRPRSAAAALASAAIIAGAFWATKSALSKTSMFMALSQPRLTRRVTLRRQPPELSALDYASHPLGQFSLLPEQVPRCRAHIRTRECPPLVLGRKSARPLPNGFSIMTRAPFASFDLPNCFTTSPNSTGGIAR